MIIQATSHGTAAKEEPFAFTYSGDFTDNRVDGVGTVRLNTSGTLTVTGSPVTIIAKIVGAGGGAACLVGRNYTISTGGGSGGIQDVEITLKAGTYEIVIGTGGTAANSTSSAVTGGDGGDTTAFSEISTGGEGGYTSGTASGRVPGAGGSPNGKAGSGAQGGDAAGGSPNGGSVVNSVAKAGGDGYVELTFS